MLAGLSIRDVILVDRLELDFASGLSALTGETGAGKSILLDALGLSLGCRADARLVRHGQPQASVSARFEPPAGHPVFALLTEHGIEATDDTVVLRRVLAADGRSRGFVNDQAVSMALLKRIGDLLVEVHGQFESQRLLDPMSHRGLLDAFGGVEAPLGEDCAAAWQTWRIAAEARRQSEQRLLTARRDEAFLRHAVDELDHLAPELGEEAELAEQRTLLQNAEKLIQTINDAATALKRGPAADSVCDNLRAALRQLERVANKAGGRLDAAILALERALTDAMEAEAELDRVLHTSDLNPSRLDQVEERLFALRAASRKHGVPVDGLVALRTDLAERLAALDDGAGALARLGQEERVAETAYRQAAERLSVARRAAAERLDSRVASELEPLRLGKAVFTTRVDPLPDGAWGPTGVDRVAFEVATNPGQPPGPIGRIASGGELSRFMLALKVVLADADAVPTLIFDEVDAGIGGAVAAAVGERLTRLAEKVQVLVVTHSPQVAARGHHHWRITKNVAGGAARTSVEILDAVGRREEIARMLAGAQITDEARAAAASLLIGSPA